MDLRLLGAAQLREHAGGKRVRCVVGVRHQDHVAAVCHRAIEAHALGGRLKYRKTRVGPSRVGARLGQGHEGRVQKAEGPL